MTYALEIEITDVVDDAIDNAFGEIEEAVENIKKFRPEKVLHQEDIDLDELLAEHHAIPIVWDIRHVGDQRPDLDDAQAWAVLQLCRERWDRLNDPMLETIRDAAEALYPKPRPRKIAEVIANYGSGDERENLVDLLADAMHWCDEFGEPFEEFYGTARLHFDEERKTTNLKGE